MLIKQSLWMVAWTSIVIVSFSGCGNQPRPTLVPATGEVTFKGDPLTAGSIIFFPDATADYTDDSPTSLLQEDGTFKMKTFPFGDGVAPGKYKVCLSQSLASAIKFPDYGNPKKTPWEIEISGTGETDLQFEVK